MTANAFDGFLVYSTLLPEEGAESLPSGDNVPTEFLRTCESMQIKLVNKNTPNDTIQ